MHHRVTMSCGLLLITLANAANVLGDTVDPAIETVIVTATRQATAGANLAQAWSDIDGTEVDKIDLQHSNQLFNRVSGAWVSRGNGQESLISLRSPVLTGAGACGAFYTAEDGKKHADVVFS